jgi:hypothetical protein
VTWRDSAARRDAVAKIAVGPGEQVLAARPALDGGWVVATTARLALVGEDGDVIAGPWHQISKARFDSDGVLHVEWISEQDPWAVRLGKPGRPVARAVKEQVTRSVVALRPVEVSGGIVRVAIRRMPDGALAPQVVAPPGVDLADQAVAAAVAEATRAAAESVGMDEAP